jgi:hypothetical protein
MLEFLRAFLRVLFSIPALAVINILLAILSLVAAFSVDKNDLSIICDIDNIEAMLFTGTSSLQIITADTAVSLIAARAGIPDFIGSPILPLFFTFSWFIKVYNSEDLLTYLINISLSTVTISAIIIGFSSASNFFVDTNKVIHNIMDKKPFLVGVKYDAKDIKEDHLKSSDKNACYIGLEMYTLSIERRCSDQTFFDCYLGMLADEELNNMITDKTKAWIFKGTRLDQ